MIRTFVRVTADDPWPAYLTSFLLRLAMHHTRRCLLASGCPPRRQQRSVAEGSPPVEPIGHAVMAVRHKRRRRAVTYCKYALRAPQVENATGNGASPPSLRNPVRYAG
ncbi:MAG: hypothetical protein ACC742_15830, partial [Thermoanaerobaculales bacterium]